MRSEAIKSLNPIAGSKWQLAVDDEHPDFPNVEKWLKAGMWYPQVATIMLGMWDILTTTMGEENYYVISTQIQDDPLLGPTVTYKMIHNQQAGDNMVIFNKNVDPIAAEMLDNDLPNPMTQEAADKFAAWLISEMNGHPEESQDGTPTKDQYLDDIVPIVFDMMGLTLSGPNEKWGMDILSTVYAHAHGVSKEEATKTITEAKDIVSEINRKTLQ